MYVTDRDGCMKQTDHTNSLNGHIKIPKRPSKHKLLYASSAPNVGIRKLLIAAVKSVGTSFPEMVGKG
jgi:hypothetical protein